MLLHRGIQHLEEKTSFRLWVMKKTSVRLGLLKEALFKIRRQGVNGIKAIELASGLGFHPDFTIETFLPTVNIVVGTGRLAGEDAQIIDERAGGRARAGSDAHRRVGGDAEPRDAGIEDRYGWCPVGLVGIDDHAITWVHGKRVWGQIDRIRHRGLVHGNGKRVELGDVGLAIDLRVNFFCGHATPSLSLIVLNLGRNG